MERHTGENGFTRGAIRAGVRVVAGYPGSPSAGVLRQILEVAPTYDIYVEWSANEKIALEVCWGAAISGARSLLCVKGVGLNVALDALMAVNLVGTRAGFVLLVGDDPSAYRSQNEQDSRLLGIFAELPMLEATKTGDASALMEYAFELSERLSLPVIVREIRSFANTPMPVELPPLPSSLPSVAPADLLGDRPQRRWIASTTNVIPRHAELHRKLNRIADEFEASPFNRVRTGMGEMGILSAGFCGEKLDATLDGLANESAFPRLDLGTLNPLPRRLIVEFLRPLSRALVLEEIEPHVETWVKAIAQEEGIPTQIFGKRTGHLPTEGELHTSHIAEALRDTGLVTVLDVSRLLSPASPLFTGQPPISSKVPPVKDGLCPGCPYEPTFYALREALEESGERGVILADPGCAVRIMLPPLEMLDVKTAMGSCVGIGAGIARTNRQVRVIACPGDSGFFHSALAGLVNAAYNRVRMLVLVLDNLTTALSGCQPSPTSGVTALGKQSQGLVPEEFARACNISFVRTIDPSDFDGTKSTLREALAHDDLSVVVMRSPCILL